MASPSPWEARFLMLAHKGPEFWRRRLRRFWPIAIGAVVLYLALVVVMMAFFDSDAEGAPAGGAILGVALLGARQYVGTMLGAAEHLHGHRT